MELARPRAEERTRTYQEDVRYLHGLNHWPTPTSYKHYARDAWKAKPTRNYLYQVYDFKKAIVLDATPSIHAEPLSDQIPTELLELASNVTEHELERMGWDRMRAKMFFDGYVIGKGLTHVFSEKDKFSGEMRLCMERVDPTRFYWDPNADCLYDAKFVVYEPSLDLARIREIFPEKGPNVKAKSTPSYGSLVKAGTRSRSDAELVTGPLGQTLIDREGRLSEQKADVCFVWIKDDTVIQKSDASNDEVTVERKYPYGRLIAFSGEVLLWDEQSPYQIDGVFPFAEYEHYHRPGDFMAFGDVQLLKSCQMVSDKNAAMLLDAQRLTSMGKFEHPIGADAYANDTNAPGAGYPVPPELMGMARWIVPQGYNDRLHAILDDMTHRDLQITSGISDVSVGLAPTAPTSGVEVQARQRAASTRVGQHLKNMNRYSSDLANLVFQMARQLYVGPRTFQFTNAYSEIEAVSVDISMIPPEIAIRVTADPDDIEKDRLQGQNIVGLISSGTLTNPMVVPFLDILLPAMGIKPQKAKELQQRAMQLATMMPPQPPPGSEQNVGPSEAPGPSPA